MSAQQQSKTVLSSGIEFMSKQSWIGKQVGGRYQIESDLGEGGMSAVYKAIDMRLDRPVAVKLIHPHLSDSDQFINRFKREGTIIAKLRHPNIIRVLDVGQEDGSAYIVLSYIAGGSVQGMLKRLEVSGEQIDLTLAITLATQIADALDYAHKRGLTHRDVKPANILLDKENNGILTDFGLVKVAGGTRFTMTGAVMGTARYMSPEQIKSVAVDSRSDIYSLGVTLFEMVSGHPPFEGDTAVTTMMKHLSDPVPDVFATNSNAVPQLAIIINRAMSKEPADRYQTAGEMAAALRQVQDEIAEGIVTTATVIARPPATSPPERLVMETLVVPPSTPIKTTAPPSQTPPPVDTPAAKSGGKKWLWLFLLLLLIGGSIAAAYFFLGGGDTSNIETATPTAPQTAVSPTIPPSLPLLHQQQRKRLFPPSLTQLNRQKRPFPPTPLPQLTPQPLAPLILQEQHNAAVVCPIILKNLAFGYVVIKITAHLQWLTNRHPTQNYTKTMSHSTPPN